MDLKLQACFKCFLMINFRYYKTKLFVTTVILLGAGVGMLVSFLVKLLEQDLSINITPPATTGLVLIILGLYDKYLWKIPFLDYLVDVPNLNGRYEGKMYYEFNNVPGAAECVIEVVQSASKIKICTFIRNNQGEITESSSIAESIVKDDSGFYTVYFFYHNGGTKSSRALDAHEGANLLKVIEAKHGNNGKTKLKGHYFTNRLIQTKGIIEAEFTGEKLKREYHNG